MIYRGAVLTLIAAVFLTVSPLSLAGDQGASTDAEASALLERGTQLRRAGRDEEALDLFQRADQSHPSPRAHAQVALAEQALGRWAAANKDLSQALAADDPWIKKNRTVLEEALRSIRSHLGRIVILGSPAHAIVSINGENVGSLPLPSPVSVAAGDVLVAVVAEGHMRVSRQITVPAGQLVRETIDLPLLPSPAAQSPLAPSEPPPSGPTATPPPVETSGQSAHSRTQRNLAIASAGFSAIGLGVGIFFGVEALSKRNDARKVCPADCTFQSGVDLWNQARTAGNNSTIAFIVGGVGLAGAAALWLTDRPEVRSTHAPEIGIGFRTLEVRGRW